MAVSIVCSHVCVFVQTGLASAKCLEREREIGNTSATKGTEESELIETENHEYLIELHLG